MLFHMFPKILPMNFLPGGRSLYELAPLLFK